MKSFFKQFILCLVIVFLIPIASVLATAEITNEVSISGNVVNVTGTISSGIGQQITLLMTDSGSRIVYIDQITSQTNGNFRFELSMPDSAESGSYTVKVGGTDVSSPAQTSFVYEKGINPQPESSAHITATAQAKNNHVQINGVISSGSGQQITLLVTDSKGKIVYIDQIASLANGNFQFDFAMPDSAESGTYTIKIGGTNVVTPLQTSFVYEKDIVPEPEVPAEITATAQITNNQVQINGVINSGENQQITLLVTDSKGKIVYIDQITSQTNGNFQFNFSISDSAESGTYTVKIGGTNVATPLQTSFIYEEVSIPEPEVPAEITATAQIANNQVQINGVINSGENQQITLLVTDSKGKIVYIDQITSQAKGNFQFEFSMPDDAESGTYTVKVGGTQVDTPVETFFEYVEMQPVWSTMIATVLADNNIVTINGNITSGPNQNIFVSIIDSNGVLVNSSTCSSSTEGNFEMKIQMPSSTASGIYTAVLVNESVLEPLNIPYLFIARVEAQSIDKNQNKNLYNALKRARPFLDSDNDGIITIQELSNISGALDISNSHIENIEGLQSCLNISELYISNNKISNLDPIAGLSNLKVLAADNNKLNTINVLPVNLKLLNIEKNQIVNLDCIQFIDKIEFLFASENYIDSIDFLNDKQYLTHLTLKNNNISDITALANNNSLIRIDLSNNMIQNIEALQGKIKLKNVRLSFNQISDISPLPYVFYHQLCVDNNPINVNDVIGYMAIVKLY